MAKVILRDLKRKLHTLTLKDGTVIRLYGNKTVTVDEAQLTDTIRNEAKAGLLAISKQSPEVATATVAKTASSHTATANNNPKTTTANEGGSNKKQSK